MGYTTWYEAGLRRAEEERRRQEEEARRRREEEARRRREEEMLRNASLARAAALTTRAPQYGPPTRAEHEVRRSGRPPRAPQPPAQPPQGTPLLGLQNPYQVDTSTPQVGASQPTQGTQTQTIRPAQPAQPPVRPPVQPPQGPQQGPLAGPLTRFGAQGEPEPEPEANPVMLPPRNTGVIYNPLLPNALQLGQQILPALQQGIQQVGSNFSTGELAKTLTDPGVWGQSLAAGLQAAFPALGQIREDHQRAERTQQNVVQQLAAIEMPNTPVGQVLDRYQYNFLEREAEPADELLMRFAPVVYAALKTSDALGAAAEVGLALEIPALDNLTLGESWAIGTRAWKVFNEQRRADMINRGWTMQGGLWQPPGQAATPDLLQQGLNSLLGLNTETRPGGPAVAQADQKDKPILGMQPDFGGLGTNYQMPNPALDLWASIALAKDEYLAALAPTALTIGSASPTEIARNIASGRSMAHHGIAAVAQQVTDLFAYPQQAQALRDQAAQVYQQASAEQDPTRREQLLFEAAELGAQAKQLAETHPVDLFNKNANWWMALPAEIIFDPLGLWEAGAKVLGLTPKLRRMSQGTRLADMTVAQAQTAMRAGRGVGATLDDAITSAGNAIPLLNKFWQSQASKAATDARANFRTLVSLFQGFETKEDLRTIVKAYITDPVALLQNGLPANVLTTPWIKQVFPAGSDADVVTFGSALFGNYEAVKAAPALQHMVEFIDSLPSLAGEGVANFGEVASDLYTLLIRGAGEQHNVATLAGVPAGATRATTKLVGDGTATVQYFAGKQLLHESEALPLLQANRRAKEFAKYVQSGQEYAGNLLENVGSVQRQLLGLAQLDSSLRGLINNAISNRMIATGDGVWSWQGFDASLAFIQGVTGGMAPYDEIASLLSGGMKTQGTVGSMFGTALGNVPLFKQLRELRQWDEKKAKVVVYARTLQDFLESGKAGRFKPAAEQFFQELGWTDRKQIANATNTLWEAALSGGRGALMRAFYDLAGGKNAWNLAELMPDYREVLGGSTGEVTQLLRNLTPEGVADAGQQLDTIFAALLDTVNQGEYVFQPGRTQYTRLDDQKQVADLQSTLQTIANQLGEDYAQGVQPVLEQIVQLQRDVNASVLQLVQMASQDGGAAGHIFALWNDINAARRNANTYLDRVGEDLRNAGWTPEAVTRWRDEQVATYNVLKFDVDELIELYRGRIAGGEAAPGDDAILPFVRNLGVDESRVFRLNETAPGAYSRDPNRGAAIQAGRDGLAKFLSQMMMVLQSNPTDSGFDHFISAIDDMSDYYHRFIGPELRQVDVWKDQARALSDQGAALKAAGDTQAGNRLYAEAKPLWNRAFEAESALWSQYYELAYGRYQAASALIAQAGGAITDLPHFTPMNHWGRGVYPDGTQFTLQGRSPKNPNIYLVKGPDGKVHALDESFIPPDALQQWNELNKNLYTRLAQEVGKYGVQLFEQGTGAKVIDDLISAIRVSTNNPVFDAVRADVAHYIANPGAYGDMGEGVARYLRGQITTLQRKLKGALPQIAQGNLTRGQAIPLEAVKRGAQTFGPLWDNLLAGGNKAAEEMVSFSLVDFINKYGADHIAGLFVPYSYWATRQGKNMVERMLFAPAFFGHVAREEKLRESLAERGGEPDRSRRGYQTDLALPNGENLFIPSPVPRWMPFGLRYIFQGWGDVDRANQGIDVLLNQMETNGWPGWAGAWGAAMTASEVAGAMGLPQYQHIRDLIKLANERGGEINLADYGFLNNLIGQGMAAVQQRYIPGVNRYYDPYMVARDVANQNFGVGEDGMPVLAAGQAQYEGRPVAPEFAAAHPEADEQWQAAYRQQALENFLFGLVGAFTSITPSSNHPSEPARLEAQRQYSNMGWSPDNPTGARERTQMLDETSPNYVPGLATGQATYQVIGEGPQREAITPAPPNYPFVPTYETRRLDEGVVLGEYLDKRRALNEQFKLEEQEMIRAHPEWAQGQDLDSYYAWLNGENGTGYYDRLKAEQAALDAQYPTVAQKYKEPTSASLRGANPIETTDAALDRLLRQAEEEVKHLEPGDYPENGSRSEKQAWNQANQAHDEAKLARLQELMNDPDAASAVVFGRPLLTAPAVEQPAPVTERSNVARKATIESETTGEIGTNGQPDSLTAPGQPAAGAPRAAALGQPPAGATVPAMAASSVTPDPNNQWFEQMAAAEQQYNLPAGLLQAVARHESSFNPDAESGAGAQGLMQIMPATWGEWAPKVGVEDPWDPEQSIAVSAAYLDWLAQQLPEEQRDIATIMAAYNWGIGNVLSKGYDSAPAETKAYSQSIVSEVNQSVMSAPQVATVGSPFAGDHPLTQEYGVNPERYKSWGGHMGLDYAMPEGTELLATQGATVVDVGHSPAGGTPSRPGTGGFGNWVILDFGNGYTAEYAHLSRIDVKPGDKLDAGQVIGLSGHTGVSDFPHLHFGVRKDGEYIDPHTYLAMQAEEMPSPVAPPVEGIVQGPATQGGRAQAQPPGTGAPPNWERTSSQVQWRHTPEQVVTDQSNRYKSDERVALEAALDQLSADQVARVQQSYPKFAHLFEEYKGVNDEDRPAWREANPMVRAINLVAYNPDAWGEMERQFGQGVVELWAKIPAYKGEDDDSRSLYYRQHPDVFLANAWLRGRPEQFDESGFDPNVAFRYNEGSDFETAKDLFGPGIWQTVREYYADVPRYVEGGANTEWKAFKRAHPEFDRWRAWWYEKLGATAPAPYGGWGQFGPRGGSSSRMRYNPNLDQDPYIRGIEAQRIETPRYGRAQGDSDNWRQYLELSKLGIKNPNR